MALVLAAATLVAVAPAWAQPPHSGHGGFDVGHHGRMMERMIERLDLTEEQRAQVEEVAKAQHEQYGPTREKLREAHKAVAQTIHAETLDEAAIRDASAAAAALEADLAVARAQFFQQIRKVLTAEQLQELHEMFDEAQERMAEGGFPPGGGGMHRRGPRPQSPSGL
jgi:Spy/CpxP family protein refolding chaperone